MTGIEKFINRCDPVMAFSLCALIYFLPISIALTETFSGVAILCYLLKRGALFYRDFGNRDSEHRLSVLEKFVSFFRAFKPVKNYLNKPFAIFIFVNFVTIFTSQNTSASFEGFMGKILQGVFIFFIFFECMRPPKRLKIFLVVFAVSGLLICSNGFYQYFTGQGFIRGHIFDGRVSSSLRQANDYATYLVVIAATLFNLFVLVNCIYRKAHESQNGNNRLLSFLLDKRTRAVTGILLMISLVSLGLTYSRGAWVAFTLVILLLGLRHWKLLLSSVLIIVTFLLIFYPKMNKERPPITDSSTFAAHNNRLGYWSRSVTIIKDYPVLGAGVNTYSSVQWRYSEGWGGYPHNSYLQMAAETGFIGLFSFLWLLFALYRNSFKNLRKMRDPALKFLLISFLAGLSGFLIHSFFDTTLYSVQLSSLLWLLIGVVVALQYVEEPNPESSAYPRV